MKKYFSNYLIVLCILVIFQSCTNESHIINEVKLIPIKVGEDYQYIDKEGQIIINPQFDVATVFRNGLALVKTSGNSKKWGYITEDGKYAIQASYLNATIFSEDLAWVTTENSAPSAINTKGETIFTLQQSKSVRIFEEGLAAFSVQDGEVIKWGFVDKNGKIKINPTFSMALSFSHGKCAVQNTDGKWGYIDTNGKIVINFQFDVAKPFFNGQAVIGMAEKFGVIGENGRYIINPQFSNMFADGDEYIIAQEDKWGWCDKEGKIIINPQFNNVSPFCGNKLAAAQSGKSYGYINKDGKYVINPQFETALPFNGKIAGVVSGNKIGFIDDTGKYLINPQFDNNQFSDYWQYVAAGTGLQSNIDTDYFDTNSIIQKITKNITENTVNGNKFSDSIAKIFEKYKIQGNPESYFSVEIQSIKLISEERISNDATYDFKMSVIPIDLNPEIESFTYYLNLNERVYNKSDAIFKALETALSGFVKDNTHSKTDFIELNGRFLAITLSKTVGKIIINIQTLQGKKNLDEMPVD